MARNRVLVPLDGSEFSERILSELTRFVTPAETTLVLLRVAHAPGGMVGRPSRPASAEVPVTMYEAATDLEYTQHPVYASQEWESMLARINDEMTATGASLTERGYAVSTAVKFGDPGAAIVHFTQDEDIDLVAMTTHGRSGLSRLWLGSVAEHVLRNVSVPVLLLRSIQLPTPEPAADKHMPLAVLPRG